MRKTRSKPQRSASSTFTWHQALYEVRHCLRPVPPPMSLSEDNVESFSCNLLSSTIIKPKKFGSYVTKSRKQCLIAHELKHASRDGLPYTFLEGKKHEAALMSGYGVSQKVAHNLLNAIYDIVIDLRLQKQGFNMKNLQEWWIKVFSPSQGSSYYVLNLLYQKLLDVKFIKNSEFEKNATVNSLNFRHLIRLVKKLARDCDKSCENKDIETIVQAAWLLKELSSEASEGDVKNNPTPDELASEVAQIAIDYNLSPEQLKDLINNERITFKDSMELLEEAFNSRVRTSLWHSQHGFEVVGKKAPSFQLTTRSRAPWRYNSKSLDLVSVALYKDDPRRWKVKYDLPLRTIPSRLGSVSAGYEKIICFLDISGNTSEIIDGKPILSHEKDVFMSLIAYARMTKTPIKVCVFNDIAKWIEPMEDDYFTIAKEVYAYASSGGTDLKEAIKLALEIDPKHCLIVILTDGEVNQGDIELLMSKAQDNRLIVLIVSDSAEDSILVREAYLFRNRIKVYNTRVEHLGNLIISELV